MQKKRRALFWLSAIVGILLLLFFTPLLIVPRVINAELTKDRLLREIQERTGIEANYSDLEVRFFPFLSITLLHGNLTAPNGISATFEALKLSPRILPLVVGTLKIDEVEIESPIVRSRIPAPLADNAADRNDSPSFPQSLKERALSPASPLAAIASNEISVIVNKGRVVLTDPKESVVWFNGIQGRIDAHPPRLEAHLTCESNLWQNFTLHGRLDPKTLTGQGQISLSRFRPQELLSYFIPQDTLSLPSSEINLDMTFQRNHEGNSEGKFTASIPELNVRRNGEEAVIKGDDLEGSFQIDNKRLEFLLSRSRFDHPKLGLNGRFVLDFNPRTMKLELEGRDVDAASFRTVALAVAGDERDMQKTFEVIRGGHVPYILFIAQGNSLKELHKGENITIKGNMVGGRIFIPKVQLEVSDARGDVVISKAVLEGRDLEGRTADSHGRNGTLTLGLKKGPDGDAPFRLDIELDAALAELPPVLQRIVPNEVFLHELSLIKEIDGRAKGKLILGESLKSVKTKVDASEFTLISQYQRIPYPVDVEGKGFVYEESFVSVGALQGHLGKSLLSGVSGSINWEKESTIKIGVSSRCALSLEEAHRWLVSYDNLRKVLRNWESVKGLLHVDGLALEGPTRRPRDWRFEGKGSVEDLVVASSLIPEPLKAKSGLLEASHKEFSPKDWTVSVLDSSMLVSGTLKGFLKELSEVDLSVSGNIGPRLNRWVTEHFPEQRLFNLRCPYGVSKGRFSWNREQKISFSGSLAAQGGTIAEVDFTKSREEVGSPRMLITDEDSNATISFGLRDKTLNIDFTGVLNNKSLDRLLESNPALTGVIKGNFRARIPTDHPMDAEVTGDLQIQGFQYGGTRLRPLIIDDGTFRAEGNSLQIQKSSLSWKDIRTSLTGRVGFSESTCNVDLNVVSDQISWEDFTGDREESTQETRAPEGQKTGDIKLTGTVRVNTQSFSYGKLKWEPFQAGVLLGPSGYSVEVRDSRLCGIPFQGSLSISGQDVELKAKSVAKKENLDATVACLWNKKELMTGTYDLKGDFSARGAKEVLNQEGLTRALKGGIELHAKGGRIHRFGLLSKILSMLNLTEIYRGKLPDLANEGFEYDTIKARGNLETGKLHLDEVIIDAPSMKMVWSGDVDLIKKEVNLTLLVAPLRTFDKVIDNVPLLGDILGGSMISIPVQVSGDLNDPTIVPLSPSAVGSKLLGHMKRAFKLPFKVIQPFQ